MSFNRDFTISDIEKVSQIGKAKLLKGEILVLQMSIGLQILACEISKIVIVKIDLNVEYT